MFGLYNHIVRISRYYPHCPLHHRHTLLLHLTLHLVPLLCSPRFFVVLRLLLDLRCKSVEHILLLLARHVVVAHVALVLLFYEGIGAEQKQILQVKVVRFEECTQGLEVDLGVAAGDFLRNCQLAL